MPLHARFKRARLAAQGQQGLSAFAEAACELEASLQLETGMKLVNMLLQS